MEFVKTLLNNTNQMLLKPDGIQDRNRQGPPDYPEESTRGRIGPQTTPLQGKLNEDMVKANYHVRSRRNSKEDKTGTEEKTDYRRRDSRDPRTKTVHTGKKSKLIEKSLTEPCQNRVN